LTLSKEHRNAKEYILGTIIFERRILMTMETTEQKSPNTDKLTKNEQVEENIDQHTDEPTVANEQTRQEGAESDVAGGEGCRHIVNNLSNVLMKS
jgi:hypothetical protein